jgi:hypothetical protein
VLEVPGAIALATNGDTLVVARENGEVTIAPAAPGEAPVGDDEGALGGAARTVPSGVQNLAVAAAADDGRVFVGGASLALLDSATGNVEATAAAAGAPVTAATFLPGEGGDVVVGHENGAVERLDGESLAPIATFPGTTGDAVKSIAAAPDGRVALAQGTSVEVITDDLGTSLATLEGHEAPVESLAFERDGGLLASGSDDRTILVWDTGSWTRVRSLFGHNDKVTGLVFAADDRLLASVSEDGTLRLWDPPTGQPIGGPMATDTRVIDTVIATGPAAAIALTLASDKITTWDLDVDAWAGLACALAGRDLTEEEWDVYAGERPYEPSCER